MRPIIDTILHPTDFSAGSMVAFHHALKIALFTKAQLTLLHVATDTNEGFADFPGVRETLERWELLPKDSPRSAVPQLGIDVRKIVTGHNDPVSAVLHYLGDHPADLIVLATHQDASWQHKSVAAPVARRAAEMTLFIPGTCAGFVNAEDGAISLQKVLVPVADSPPPQAAVDEAVRLTSGLNANAGTFSLFHVGSSESMPAVKCPEVPGWDWKTVSRSGDVVQEIVGAASNAAADLVVMATDGRNGFLDVLRGSHSERVLRQVSAPLLTVPSGLLARDPFASR